ncbi:MAG: DUF3806 domain-containing protein [Pseudomonadota bacterium]
MSKEPEPINIKTPEGNVIAHKETIDPVPQEISVITGDELNHLKSLVELCPRFVATYLPNDNVINLKTCDLAFRAWQISKSPNHSNEKVVEILGGYLGNKCIADLNMEWVTVTDEYGTDYAVRSKISEVMAFPFSTVMKRIEDNEYDFLYNVYFTIKQTLESGDYKPRNQELSN